MELVQKKDQEVNELLTNEEKVIYFQIKAKLYRSDLYNDMSQSEYKYLYNKASQILLAAIERNLERKGLA